MAALAVDEEADEARVVYTRVCRALDVMRLEDRAALGAEGWNPGIVPERWRAAVDAALAQAPVFAARPPELLVLCSCAYQVEHLVRVCGVDPDGRTRLFENNARWGGVFGFYGINGAPRAGLSVLGARSRTPARTSVVVAALLAEGAHVDAEGQAVRAYVCPELTTERGFCSPLTSYVLEASDGPKTPYSTERYRAVVYAFMCGRGADTLDFALDAQRLASAVVEGAQRWNGRYGCEAGVARPLRAVSQVRAVVHAARRRLPRELVRMCANFMGLGMCPRARAS